MAAPPAFSSLARTRLVDALKAEKAELRKRQRVLRDSMASDEHQFASTQSADHILSLLSQYPCASLSAFWPLGSEIDLRGVLRVLAEKGRTIALPVMQGAGRGLIFRRWQPGDELRTVKFGVQEPLDTSELVDPDFMLVPLLAVDRRGYRLGYGGGFYDRTIQAARERGEDFATWGIGFEWQWVERVPIEDTDQPLDGMIVESGLHPFGGT